MARIASCLARDVSFRVFPNVPIGHEFLYRSSTDRLSWGLVLIIHVVTTLYQPMLWVLSVDLLEYRSCIVMRYVRILLALNLCYRV